MCRGPVLPLAMDQGAEIQKRHWWATTEEEGGPSAEETSPLGNDLRPPLPRVHA